MTLPDGFSDGQALQAVDENQQRLAKHGYGVVSGAAVSLGTGNLGSGEATVDVAAGTLLVDGASTSTSATSVTIGASDSNPRKDLVVYDTGSSAFTAIGGVPAAAKPDGAMRQQARRPAPDSLDNSVVAVSSSGDPQIPLAEVWVPADATGIAADDIFDRRQGVLVRADTVDGYHGSDLAALGENETVTGTYAFNNEIDGAVRRAAKTFGPMVNGGHSDFSDAQAAIDFADTTSHTHMVGFPPGTYGSITIPEGMTVQGGGRSPSSTDTALFSSASGPAVSMPNLRSCLRYCGVENTSSASSTEHAILAQGGQNSIVGVFLNAAGDDGIHSTNSDFLEVNSCYAASGGIASDSIVLDSDTSNAIVTNNPGIGTVTDNGTSNVVANNT